MKRWAAAGIAWMAVSVVAVADVAGPPEETPAERASKVDIVKAVQRGDCSNAVALLNRGLAAKYPSHYLIGGTMYEEGLCIKPSWERAQQLYQRGFESGHHGGLWKLVAGLARPDRSPATALWWAQHGKLLPAECIVPQDMHLDAERYVAALGAWPAGRLQACAYAAGVIATLGGDLEYPEQALFDGARGSVRMVFTPALGRFDWDMKGVTSDRLDVVAQRRLQAALETAAARALKRFPLPTGIDPAWKLSQEYVFTLR